MTSAEMLIRVNMLLDKINSFQADTLLPNEVYRALNMAQETFIKQRYGRANKYGRGFEEMQKRIDDLAPLLVDANININYSQQVGENHFRDVICLLPNDIANAPNDSLPYMFLVNVRASLKYVGCKVKLNVEEDDYWQWGPSEEEIEVTDETTGAVTTEAVLQEMIASNEVGIGSLVPRVEVEEPLSTLKTAHTTLCKFVQNDDIFTVLKDPFNTTKLTSPIYSMSGFSGTYTSEDNVDITLSVPQIEIYTDSTFFVDTVHIRYIRTPNDIAEDQDCQLANHTHQEIVNMAVDLLLESISDPRYKSHQAETVKSD